MEKDDLSARRAELERRKAELKQEEAALREEELAMEREEARKHWNLVLTHKEAFIALVKHDRSSCNDTNITNGWGSAEYGARCAKCAMLEVINGNYPSDMFDISFEPVIRKLEEE